jgi:hypothetical protein
MVRLLKASAITLLAALTLAPVASASVFRHHHKKVVIYYQSPSGTTWYEVSTTKDGAPVYTYTVPVTNAPIYVYQAPAPPPALGDVKIVAPAQPATVWIDGQYAGTTDNIMQVALEAGSHDMQLKDTQGNTLFSGSVNVVAGQTTQIQPQ